MSHKVFVDSNIIIYAYDLDAGERHKIAADLLRSLWLCPVPASISIQVLQECYVNFIRKGISEKLASGIVEDLLQWNVVANDASILLEGIRLRSKCQVSFWDSLILAAAKSVSADQLLSEDFGAGRLYEGIKVVNPFSGI
jgi:predicted nucleic acid-binding protein